MAAYIREKGYTFDAEAFWNYYESKGWIVGRTPMKKWRSACVTWQRHAQAEQRSAARPAARRRPSNWIAPTPEQVKEFEDDFS